MNLKQSKSIRKTVLKIYSFNKKRISLTKFLNVMRIKIDEIKALLINENYKHELIDPSVTAKEVY